MSCFSLDNHLFLWITDFLTNRSQRVFVNGCFSELSLTCTGSPQGCVLSPLFYILYTDDCRSNHLNRLLVKFADNSALLSLLQGSEQYHGPALSEFVAWCDNSYLDLNVTKTKEMIVDFRRQGHSPGKTIIPNNEVEIVSKYKYLGTIFDDKLKWDDNTEEIVKKGQQRLYLLRNLKILTLFYKSFIESVLSFSFICWFHSLGVKKEQPAKNCQYCLQDNCSAPERPGSFL